MVFQAYMFPIVSFGIDSRKAVLKLTDVEQESVMVGGLVSDLFDIGESNLMKK